MDLLDTHIAAQHVVSSTNRGRIVYQPSFDLIDGVTYHYISYELCMYQI